MSLRAQVEYKLSDTRKILRLISTPLFDRLWSESKKQQRVIVERYVLDNKVQSLRAWITLHDQLAPGEMSVTQLRNLAVTVGVVGASRMRKIELIQALEGRDI